MSLPAAVPPTNPPVAVVANRRGGGRRDRPPDAAAAANVDSDSENEGQEYWRQRMDRFFQRQDDIFIMRRNEITERRRREAIQRQMEEEEEDLALEVAAMEPENRNVPFLIFDRQEFRSERARFAWWTGPTTFLIRVATFFALIAFSNLNQGFVLFVVQIFV